MLLSCVRITAQRVTRCMSVIIEQEILPTENKSDTVGDMTNPLLYYYTLMLMSRIH